MLDAMQVLAVSDTVVEHLLNPDLQDRYVGVDLILSCGDLPPEFLGRLKERFNVPVFYVRGNHDIRYPHRSLAGCTNLHAKVIEYNGLRMAGLEGCRWYNGGPAQYSEMEMKRILRRLKPLMKRSGGIDIMLSHAPPRHVHDKPDRCHKGFKCFHQIIEKYKPRYWFHGHIHAEYHDPAERITRCHQTEVINCYEYFLIDIVPAQPHSQAF